MSINKEADRKGVKEILHFTTNHGLLGILAQDALLPNSMLKKEDSLAFIFKQNSEWRREKNQNWLGYVNLSVSKLNKEFFSYSEYQHRESDIFWVILSFTTELLDDSGVYFTTTNNIYPSCLRGLGLESFNLMFAAQIVGKFQKQLSRSFEHLPFWTTCEQAEVLYPGILSLKYLKKIYVRDKTTKHSVSAQLGALGKSYEVCISPEKFS